MAKNIKEGGASGATVHQLNPKKPGAGRKLAAAAAAAEKAETMLGGKSVREAQAGIPVPEADAVVQAALPEPKQTAPAFGANEPDVGVFLKHVNILRTHEVKITEAKLVVKNLNKTKKDLRNAAKESGIVMGELDMALEHLDTERVDLRAKVVRYLRYMEWLGRPLEINDELPSVVAATPTDTEQRQQLWFQRGDQAGRLGEMRGAPPGCVGDDLQCFLKGWDHGQGILMQGSPLTKGAFNADGSLKTAAQAPAAAQAAAVLILKEADFAAGTTLEEANLKTLIDERREAFAAAERVVALFGAAKRIIKEEGYVDDGEPESDLTEPEPATEEELAAVGQSAAEFA